MQQFEQDRLKTSRNGTVAENGNHRARKPRVRQTSDGLEADFPARPDYTLGILTVREASGEEPIADGGTDTVSVSVDVFRCGGCEETFTEDDTISNYTIESTGETVDSATGYCPHCGTPVSDDRTLKSAATFDVPERDLR